MEGIGGEHSIAELCRKYGISDNTYYKWNKDFLLEESQIFVSELLLSGKHYCQIKVETRISCFRVTL